MSAEVETMAYHGETPWHKMGTRVDHLMTSAEALVASGLDWLVEKSPVLTIEGQTIPNGYQIRRVKDKEHYCFVTADYIPFQNVDAFKFADNIVLAKEGMYETAGSLRKGAIIWLLMKLNDMIYIKGDVNEAVAKYILLKNSHDTELAVQVMVTPIRVVCMNTLRMAVAQGKNVFYSKHTGDINTKVAEARETLGVVNRMYEAWKLGAEMMTDKQVSESVIKQTLYTAFRQDIAMPMEALYKPTQREMVAVRTLFEGKGKGLTNPTIKGSRYALYNAVCEHIDFRDYRVRGDERRLNNVWFGSGCDAKNRAYDFLTQCPDNTEGSEALVRKITKIAESKPEEATIGS